MLGRRLAGERAMKARAVTVRGGPSQGKGGRDAESGTKRKDPARVSRFASTRTQRSGHEARGREHLSRRTSGQNTSHD